MTNDNHSSTDQIGMVIIVGELVRELSGADEFSLMGA